MIPHQKKTKVIDKMGPGFISESFLNDTEWSDEFSDVASSTKPEKISPKNASCHATELAIWKQKYEIKEINYRAVRSELKEALAELEDVKRVAKEFPKVSIPIPQTKGHWEEMELQLDLSAVEMEALTQKVEKVTKKFEDADERANEAKNEVTDLKVKLKMNTKRFEKEISIKENKLNELQKQITCQHSPVFRRATQPGKFDVENKIEDTQLSEEDEFKLGVLKQENVDLKVMVRRLSEKDSAAQLEIEALRQDRTGYVVNQNLLKEIERLSIEVGRLRRQEDFGYRARAHSSGKQNIKTNKRAVSSYNDLISKGQGYSCSRMIQEYDMLRREEQANISSDAKIAKSNMNGVLEAVERLCLEAEKIGPREFQTAMYLRRTANLANESDRISKAFGRSELQHI